PAPFPNPSLPSSILGYSYHSFLQDFLSKDPCFQISDKYLLAMVLVYFRRANLPLSEYTHSNLFLALYLANDMEEDPEDPKSVIFLWALGRDWHHQVSDFLHQRDKLWARMGFRAIVRRQSCEEVMAKEPTHWAWTRERHPHHGRAQRSYPKAQVPLPRGPGLSPPRCPLCALPPHRSLCWDMGLIPGPGRFHMPVQLCPCTTVTEPVLWTPRAVSPEPECDNYGSSRTRKPLQ
uniref:Speedy protein C n=1 Tax=Moschus moschiferus TaxID=68415 RepID=A0A8C6CVV2_MOSMO